MKDPKLVAYCGLYCGDCPFHRTEGNIPDLARDLRKVLRQSNFEAVAKEIPFKEFKNYKQCYECLGVMVKLRCKRACKDGGGNPFCKIRKCSQKKGHEGCWKCSDFEKCNKLKSMSTVHKNALILNLKKIKKEGINNFIEGKRYW